MTSLIGSIVTFHPKWSLLETTIKSFLDSTNDSIIVVWDNSPDDQISSKLAVFGERVRYHLSPKNLGYGRGNNQVFRLYGSSAKYFCVLNPDLEFPAETMPNLLGFMKDHPQWELVSGSICRPMDTIDPVHKLLPSFVQYALEFTCRKFLKIQLFARLNKVFLNLSEGPSRLPIMSGCFMLFTTQHFKELQGFDERFFLYFEDWDLSLRSYLSGKSLILPKVKILHAWNRESHKKFAIFLLHLKSAFTFYKKWGLDSKISRLANERAGYWNENQQAPVLTKDL